MPEEDKPRRPYRSERRREGAALTRQRILDAASKRFVDQGYAGTTIASIAADAGTAAETVYATFGSKVAVLEAVVRGAARGNEEAEIPEQAGPARVAATTDPRQLLRLFAADVVERLERVGPLLVVLAHAAASEPSLADLYRRLHEARLQNLRTIATMLAQRKALRVGEDEAAETVWALASPELHTLLTRLRGWSRERYITWLADTLAGALLPAPR